MPGRCSHRLAGPRLLTALPRPGALAEASPGKGSLPFSLLTNQDDWTSAADRGEDSRVEGPLRRNIRVCGSWNYDRGLCLHTPSSSTALAEAIDSGWRHWLGSGELLLSAGGCGRRLGSGAGHSCGPRRTLGLPAPISNCRICPIRTGRLVPLESQLHGVQPNRARSSRRGSRSVRSWRLRSELPHLERRNHTVAGAPPPAAAHELRALGPRV